MFRRPAGGAATDFKQEIREHLAATGRVRDLGMELHGVQRQPVVFDRRNRRILTRRRDVPSRRRLVHVVAMAHPHRRRGAGGKSLEKLAALNANVRSAVFPPRRRNHAPASKLCQHLHPVAQPEHRDAHREELRLSRGHPLAVHRVRPTRQDHALRLPVADPRHVPRRRMDLAIHMLLPHPARNQLGELRTEVHDQDPIGVAHESSPAKGSATSSRNRSLRRSRGRTTAHRPSSTSTSTARAREL